MVETSKNTQTTYPDITLTAQKLNVRRGGRHVFEDISISLTNHSIQYLHGTNGSGKSTLIRTLSERLTPISGDISLQIDGEYAEISQNLMVLDHSNGLKNTFTLLEHCSYFSTLLNGEKPEKHHIEQCLETLKLQHLINQPIKYFSSGQRRRAALLRFLLVDRPIWLMDEPTVGVDAENRAALADMLKRHIKKGGAAIVATHDDIGVEGEVINLDQYTPKMQYGGYWS
ncbi:heme ABC exporter ATP-binding protein CcmA [Kordiimonas sp. SCSIO 12610]|uniref:heme ABC exporter ATP-binding protein CcmA n=1 Tax=Kordiimonas sp. SCSIO 12610 TaxID=2829597 RepID=UPI00210B7683|nr:heme ABC exporter ATP-binding protein CcmA [Kordiimonas sp. SCSIO 12610]UTW55633.1 heme ABC exporter ATP-binding protein CcmA [Kordiimonas sp. SCSIO 12610]